MKEIDSIIKEKFKNVPIEKDTKILSIGYMKVGEYDARIERWFWEGVHAFSMIFLKTDVEHISTSNLIDLIRQKTGIIDEFEFSDSGEYLFFSYGFTD